jgi:hypothetical protein
MCYGLPKTLLPNPEPQGGIQEVMWSACCGDGGSSTETLHNSFPSTAEKPVEETQDQESIGEDSGPLAMIQFPAPR